MPEKRLLPSGVHRVSWLPITLKASGKIAVTRGVSDSTTLFGFYHSHDSMRKNESQKNGVPESVMGIPIRRSRTSLKKLLRGS